MTNNLNRSFGKMLLHYYVQRDFIHIDSLTGGSVSRLSYFRCFPKVIGTVQIASANIVKKLDMVLRPVVKGKIHFFHAAFVRKNVLALS